MPIVSTDIDFKHSGGASNSDGDASLGGVISSNDIPETLHALFDIVSSSEASAGDVEYRCLYIQNNHGSLTAQNGVVWIQSQTSSGDTDLAIGLGTAGVSTTEQTIANESTAPAGVTFSAPATEGAGIAIPDLAAGEYHALWLRRTVNAAASAFNNDTATIRVAVDTAE